MATAYEVPITPSLPQRFSITLANVVYQFLLQWNNAAACWVLDIADLNNNPMVQGLPLVTGTNLLGQFAYLGIGGALVVQSDNDPTLVPTFSSLGATGHLFFVTTP